MPRYVFETGSYVRVLNEKGVEVGSFFLDGTVAVNTSSRNLDQIIDSTVEDFAGEVALRTKKLIREGLSQSEGR